MRSGRLSTSANALVQNLRQIMLPNTAVNLKERNSNKLRDFVHVAGQLGITHFMIVSQTERGTNLRIARSPKGPTMSFRVQSYSLMRDIVAAQTKPKSGGYAFQHAPLLVLNNFNAPDAPNHVRLMATMFQNMFPPIQVQSINLKDVRRVVLIHYDSDSESIMLRHYCITVKPVGISKSVKRIITCSVPNLNQFGDISEYVLRESHAAESDVEEAGENVVALPRNYIGRNNRADEQRAVKLEEVGPRVDMALVKIEQGFCDGEVLFHRFIQKTPEEIQEQRKQVAAKQQEKERRRKEQEANIERKAQEREEHKERCLRGMNKNQQPADEEVSDEDANVEQDDGEYAWEDEDVMDEDLVLSEQGEAEELSDSEDDAPQPPPSKKKKIKSRK